MLRWLKCIDDYWVCILLSCKPVPPLEGAGLRHLSCNTAVHLVCIHVQSCKQAPRAGLHCSTAVHLMCMHVLSCKPAPGGARFRHLSCNTAVCLMCMHVYNNIHCNLARLSIYFIGVCMYFINRLCCTKFIYNESTIVFQRSAL